MSPYAQLLGPFPHRSRTGRPEVALTFEDGPNEPYTSQIADYLGGKGIRATFFQVGRAVRAHPDVTARLARAGHVIGHHSDTHQFTRYLHRDSLREELAAGLTTFAAGAPPRPDPVRPGRPPPGPLPAPVAAADPRALPAAARARPAAGLRRLLPSA